MTERQRDRRSTRALLSNWARLYWPSILANLARERDALPEYRRSLAVSLRAVRTAYVAHPAAWLWGHRPAPWSLRRAAYVDRWRRLELPLPVKLADVTRALARKLSAGIMPFGWITFVCLIPLLPFVKPPWSLRALKDPSKGQTFLQTLWQVDAAAIALSLAMALFAFESVRELRSRGSLTRFARETRLTYVLALSMAAIFNIGAVLLGLGHGAPGGWAATWASIVSGLALASIPFLLHLALRSMEPARLLERRRRQTRDETAAATEDDIFRRIAMVILKEKSEEAGVSLRPMLFHDLPENGRYVYPAKGGVVSDIRLRRLRHLRSASAGTEPMLLAEFGAYVSPSRPIAVIGDGTSRRRERAIRRIARIRSGDSHTSHLEDEFDELHESALRAIRDGLPKTYDDIADEYVEALTALPAAWRRYGEDYNQGAASGIAFFESMPLDRLEEHIWNELREACRAPHREVAYRAIVLPYRVALRAIDVNAEALFVAMLRLYIQIYPEARGARDADVRKIVHGRCASLASSVAKSTSYRLEDDGLEEAERDRLERFVERAQTAVAELSKVAMDEDPSDTQTLSEISSDWDEIFMLWNPQHDSPYEWEVRHALTLPPTDPHRVEFEARLARSERQVHTRESVLLWRDALRFGLAFWAYHNLLLHGPRWSASMDHYRRYFGGVEHLTRAADRAIRAGEREPWFYWRLDQTRGAHVGPAVDWEMIRAFLAFAILLIDPTQPPPRVKQPAFFAHQHREVKQMLVEVANNHDLWSVVAPPADFVRRVARVWQLLRRSEA